MADDDTCQATTALSQWLLPCMVAVVPTTGLAIIWADTEASERDLFLAHVLYWLMPLIVVFVAACGWQRLRAARPLREQLASWWLPIVSAVALVMLVFWFVPPELRMQLDETHLVSVSQNMHGQRMAVVTTAAMPGVDGLDPVEQTVDKRPPSFAFAVSLLHDVTGYRVGNAFTWNGALFALALALLFRATRARHGVVAAFAAQLLLVSVPLTVVTATSAGFELMACTWLLLVVLAAIEFVREPDTPRFAGLLSAGMLFAHARYESLPAALLLLVAIALCVRGRFRFTSTSATLLGFVPPLLAPLVMLLLHGRNPKFYPEAAGQDLVSLSHLFDHIGPFLAAFFDCTPSAVLPGVLAIVAVLALALRWWRREGGVFDLLVGLPVLAIAGVALLWFYGDVREQTAMRLFLPITWLGALLPLALVRSFGQRAAIALLVVGVGLLAWRLPGVAAGDTYARHRYTEMCQQLERAAEALTFDPQKTLWIGVPAPWLTITERPGVTVNGFLRRAREVDQAMRERRLETMFVVVTEFDRAMAGGHGSPRQLLSRIPNELVAQVGEPQKVFIYQLRP